MISKVFLRRNIDRISITKQYFLRGHNSWFALAFTLMNFTLIFYDLLFVDLYFIPPFFKSYLIFLICFASIYFPLATIVGLLDYKKGTFSAEQTMQLELSPVWKQLFQKIDKLENDKQEILSILKDLQKKT